MSIYGHWDYPPFETHRCRYGKSADVLAGIRGQLPVPPPGTGATRRAGHRVLSRSVADHPLLAGRRRLVADLAQGATATGEMCLLHHLRLAAACF